MRIGFGHTAASEMLRCGASLPEVGVVLRHRRAATTAIYAKVDRQGAQADRASVAGSGPVSALRVSLAEYLAVRRALGYKLEGTERLLGQFLDYLNAIGADRITIEHALAWATLPGGRRHWHAMRLGAV